MLESRPEDALVKLVKTVEAELSWAWKQEIAAHLKMKLLLGKLGDPVKRGGGEG